MFCIPKNEAEIYKTQPFHLAREQFYMLLKDMNGARGSPSEQHSESYESET